ncbi:MAG: GNAT family N-acetyltransferase [Alphaproteobacteria bacterium]|nr:GNAT family N-acetyltransferase [Alphaproteobacteria bacterium]
MFLIKEKEFLLREFSQSDLKELVTIAHNINKQAYFDSKYQPFYAFNVALNDQNYQENLLNKTQSFLNQAEREKNTIPRSTYRLALCLPNNKLIGNITLDILPQKDKNGKIIWGDLGYFINPEHGRMGLMSKALENVLIRYFRYHNRMDITIHPENIYSLQMMQRFNAKIIGLKKQSDYQGEPRLLLTLSKEDFLSRKKPVCISKKTIHIPILKQERGLHV